MYCGVEAHLFPGRRSMVESDFSIPSWEKDGFCHQGLLDLGSEGMLQAKQLPFLEQFQQRKNQSKLCSTTPSLILHL
jgi:hypothetical protein